MNKKLTSLSFFFVTLALSGCSSSTNILDIEFSESVVAAYVGVEYDFSDNIVMEEGVTYSIEAYYQDYYKGVEVSLPVNGFVFTPVEKFDVSVVVTGKKGDLVGKNTITVPVEQKGDPIDELLVSGGYSGWADAGFRKELVTDEAYLKGENSHSAISVVYQGNNAFRWGGSVLCINNFRCLECWEDKTWDNAIIAAWIYNPTDYNLEFQLRIVDTSVKNGVDIDWGQNGQIPQIAEPGKWTHIFFSLKKYGITHTLFENEEGTRKDSLTIKTQWAGAPKDEFTPPYSFNFYVDGIDVVPHTKYPDIDTRCPDPIEKVVETSWYDTGFKLIECYDASKIIEGESSIEIQFSSSEKYMAGGCIMCLNSPSYLPLWKDQAWEDAVLTFCVFNDSPEEIEFSLRVYSPGKIDLDWGEPNNPVVVAHPGQWTQLFFPLKIMGVDSPLYKDGAAKFDEFNVKAHYKGAESAADRYSYHAYIDGINVVPSGDCLDVPNE
ncbi:MAG: hypothetical protein MJ239_02350 [Bacilli bacterium]|nr:hypothetical protein [Bacilli bacterium]